MQETYTIGTRSLVLDREKAEAALQAKRVIGGRETMTFNLAPLRYGWAYELYRTMKANHWEPEDVPMGRDVEQWRAGDSVLSDVDRWIVRMAVGYFSAAEGIVGDNDIRDFLELRKNTGDERRRTHDMNTANWIPDLFMKRVEARESWTLFRSSDVPDLHEHYGRDFEARYVAHEERVRRGEIHGESIPAIELWKLMLKALFETGHPWITFQDPCNVRSPQDHAGVVHSSNLCTEITLNTSEEETAVCNLGSIVIDQHLTHDGEIDHVKLRETVRIAVRALDDVIDVNFSPTAAARTANDRHRPVGLGVMGLQYALYRKGIAFGSDAAVEFSDEMMEAIALHAYEASSDLAAERGTYRSYPGSKWDRGLLPQDTVDLLEQERGLEIPVPRGGKLDWAPVRAKIARQGMRNSNVLAIAPTATIANIVGTSPCIEPMYKNLFAKSNLSGDFTILNPYLVRDLKAAGLWTEAVAGQIKLHGGDLSEVAGLPAEIGERYRTAFQIPTEYLIDAAARRQKWIDQSQSLPVPLRARHEGDEPHVPPRVAGGPEDDLLPAHARRLVDREVVGDGRGDRRDAHGRPGAVARRGRAAGPGRRRGPGRRTPRVPGRAAVRGSGRRVRPDPGRSRHPPRPAGLLDRGDAQRRRVRGLPVNR